MKRVMRIQGAYSSENDHPFQSKLYTHSGESEQ